MKRIRTTFTFQTFDNADRFRAWLQRNENDSDYGHPKFIDLRRIGVDETCIEYEYDANNQTARGVATGIDL